MSNWNSKPRPSPPPKSAFIEQFENEFAADIVMGGCDTCGYGGIEGMDRESFAKLLVEMDQWINERFHQSSGDKL